MTTTIREVARRAGVSVATVSRVLNDNTPVAEATRRRVEDAVRTLRYFPHAGARSLITRRTTALGVLLPDLYGEFFSEVIRGLDNAARSHGYHVLLSGSHSDPGELDTAVRAMRGRVDGLIVMSPDFAAEALTSRLPEGLPCVLLNSSARNSGCDTVSIDNVGGAKAIVTHLLSHGHDRVAIINGPPSNNDARERLRGYRAALGAARVSRSAVLELPGNFTEEAGYDAGRAMLALKPVPTAVFAANDSMAVGAMSAFREAGRRIPEDIAVGGFDDIPIAHYLTLPLTSVHVPTNELGTTAVDLLVQAMARSSTHTRHHKVVQTTLLVRNTCGVHDQPRRPEAQRIRRRTSFSQSVEADL